MKEQNKKAIQDNRSTRSNKRIIITAIIIIVISLVGWFIWNNIFRNYAAEIAAPIEKVIIDAGGVKESSSGDAGRIPDNTEPYYDAEFKLKGNKQLAIDTINKAAEKNGYKLTHATADNKGPYPVADEFVDQWFFDTKSKPNPYSDLKSGTITLLFKIGDKDGNTAGDPIQIRIHVSLPSFK